MLKRDILAPLRAPETFKSKSTNRRPLMALKRKKERAVRAPLLVPFGLAQPIRVSTRRVELRKTTLRVVNDLGPLPN